jgi:hypothetical protein
MRLPERHDATVPGVIAWMEELSDGLPPRDGIACFNGMYLETTRQVAAALAGRTFVDRAFIDRLDVRFAELYFDALEAYDRDPTTAPACWAALFEARSHPGIHPLQYAIAGMSAHILYDLPRALVLTVEEAGGELDDPGRRQDYEAVNDVLCHTQPIVKEALLAGRLASLDDAMGEVDDRLRMWAIEGAREAAWVSARVFTALDGPALRRRYERGLDRSVELSSRMLLKL